MVVAATLHVVTPEENALLVPSIRRYDRHTPLVYADWLRDRDRHPEADYWQAMGEMRQEIAERPVTCSSWLYSCTELAGDWNQLTQMGCTNCVRWAFHNLRAESLRKRAGITGGSL